MNKLMSRQGQPPKRPPPHQATKQVTKTGASNLQPKWREQKVKHVGKGGAGQDLPHDSSLDSLLELAAATDDERSPYMAAGHGAGSSQSIVDEASVHLNFATEQQPHEVPPLVGAGGHNASGFGGSNMINESQVDVCQGAQGQGQGFQSQNASSIMMQNDFAGLMDESGVMGFGPEPVNFSQHEDLQQQPVNMARRAQGVLNHHQRSGSGLQPPGLSHQSSLANPPPRQEATRLLPAAAVGNDENTDPHSGGDPLSEARNIKVALSKLTSTLVPSNLPLQVTTLLSSLQAQATRLETTIQRRDDEQAEWRSTFKDKVRRKVVELKAEKKEELRKAEDQQFKQQIVEFELQERVKTLEVTVKNQEEEINKQANANEILKYEKMRLIQDHGKALIQIEKSLAKIQIQRKQNQLNPPDSQQNRSKPTNEPFQHSSELSQLATLVGSLKRSCDQRHKAEIDQNDFQDGASDLKAIATGAPAEKAADEQHSLSDIVFNPQHKLMNNFFQETSGKDRAAEESNALLGSDDAGNQAVILDGESSRSPKLGGADQDQETELGDLAQQLNDTSFFAGNNGGACGDLYLPDNLNFFSRNDTGEVGSFIDEERLLLRQESTSQKKKKKAAEEIVDSDDKEVAELFRDSSDSVVLANDRKRKGDSKSVPGVQQKGKGRRQQAQDVDFDDLMRASVATDMKQEGEQLGEHKAFQGLNSCDMPGVGFEDDKETSLDFTSGLKKETLLKASKGGDGDEVILKHDANISLALPDLSAIVSEIPINEKSLLGQGAPDQESESASEDDRNLADLNRKLMPSFVVKAGGKDIKMPLLDLERVLALFESKPFSGNLKAQTNESLQTDTILASHKDLLLKQVEASQTSGGSFLNETGSKQQAQSETQLKSLKSVSSKPQNDFGLPSVQSDPQIDLNNFDQAISAIMDEAPFDGDSDIVEVPDLARANPAAAIKKDSSYDGFGLVTSGNVLDSLREELLKEDQLSSQLHQERCSVSPSPPQPKQQLVGESPATSNSMPFELRDSAKSKVTENSAAAKESGLQPNGRGGAGVMEYDAHKQNLQSLKSSQQPGGQAKISVLKDSCFSNGTVVNTGMAGSSGRAIGSLKKNEFATLSQKDFDKKSQMMRLSELDSIHGADHNAAGLHPAKSEKEEVMRTQKLFGKLPSGKQMGSDSASIGPRNRAPSENVAFERQSKQRCETEVAKFLSPHGATETNGTDSMVGSLQTQSVLGDKSRLSAPVTIPVGSHHQTKQVTAGAAGRVFPPRKDLTNQAYTTEIVNEVEDEESKIISINNSSSKLISQDEIDQSGSIQMLAYNSAYPHTTKNKRQIKTQAKGADGDSSGAGQGTDAKGQKPFKKTRVSIQRVQHHAQMSSLIRNQQKSSSIQRLKIVKKGSVNSAAAGQSVDNNYSSIVRKRDVLSANSVERDPSAGGNSSMSLLEQSRLAGKSIIVHKNTDGKAQERDYAPSAAGASSIKSKEARLSINTRKSKPITVSFKNIVKAGLQKRQASKEKAQQQLNEGEQRGPDDNVQDRADSLINQQRSGNPALVKSMGGSSSKTAKTGKVSLSKPSDGKTLNITVMRQAKGAASDKGKQHASKTSVDKAQICLLNNSKQHEASSCEETRDGSVIFVRHRKSTVERVLNDEDAEMDPQNQSTATVTKAGKMLIQAHQIKQRKLSIGSAHAAAATLLVKQPQANNPGVSTQGRRVSLAGQTGTSSRAQTEKSQVTSPASPRRLSSKSIGGVKIQNQNKSMRVAVATPGTGNEKPKKRSDSAKPQQSVAQTKAVRKSNIISLKRRDAVATESTGPQGQQAPPSAQKMIAIVRQGGERGVSVDTEGNQNSKRSQYTADANSVGAAPSLKIKRMAKGGKSGSTSQKRSNSTRPATVLQESSGNVNKTTFVISDAANCLINQSSRGSVADREHSMMLMRDFQSNQMVVGGGLSNNQRSNTILGADMSLLSKLGVNTDSKGQIVTSVGQGQNSSMLLLANQSSHKNLPSSFYDDGGSQQHQPHQSSYYSTNPKRVFASKSSHDSFKQVPSKTVTAQGVATDLNAAAKGMKIVSSQKAKTSSVRR